MLTGNIFKIRRDSSCQTKNGVAYYLNWQKQGEYKSHIKNNMKCCKSLDTLLENVKAVLDNVKAENVKANLWQSDTERFV